MVRGGTQKELTGDAEAAFAAAMRKEREVATQEKLRRGADRNRKRVKPHLAIQVAAFEVTANPVFAWRAIAACLRYRLDMPPLIAKFLARAAGNVEVLSREDNLTEQKKIEAMIELLWLRPGKHPFASFRSVQRGFHMRSWMAITSPNSGFVYEVKIGEDSKPGMEITRTAMIALAKKAGIAESKARDEIALANKINKRAAKILKNWSKNSESV